MTVKELSQLFYLQRSIEIAKETLEDLEESLDVRSPGLSDMPKAGGARDRIGDVVPEIADRISELEEMIREAEARKKELMSYIRRVPNTRIRLILQLRFVDLMSWQEVADRIGGRETEYTVKKTCYRYLNGLEGDEK